MLPIRHSTIFKNRWWALIWAAGICWTAVQVAQGSAGNDSNESDNASASDSNQTAGLVRQVGQP